MKRQREEENLFEIGKKYTFILKQDVPKNKYNEKYEGIKFTGELDEIDTTTIDPITEEPTTFFKFINVSADNSTKVLPSLDVNACFFNFYSYNRKTGGRKGKKRRRTRRLGRSRNTTRRRR